MMVSLEMLYQQKATMEGDSLTRRKVVIARINRQNILCSPMSDY